MPSTKAEEPERRQGRRWHGGLARFLGIVPGRQAEIYLQLVRATTLRDGNHWLLILFAAGIATLGLILNSPAVIIGAMLISPLMGPILAAGLALAAGDLVLGLRAGLNLVASCALAIGFAVLLTAVLPFKEMTAEIAARTQPTTLDFVIALLSGLVGSVAICKDAREVATSIPGVAIAVALMPPLCVVGYGAGYALSVDAAQGLRVAQGGGLLFLTNLIAITFTAMVVFLAVRLDGESVRAKVLDWYRQDGESAFLRGLFVRFPALERRGPIGSLPVRVATVVTSIALLLIPLSRSFSQLRHETERQREENRILSVARSVWQERFGRLPTGEPRSFIEHMTLKKGSGQTELVLSVFTSEPCAEAEKSLYTDLVAARLGRSTDSLALQLIEIPTARAALKAKRDELAVPPPPPPPPGVAQLHGKLEQRLSSGLRGLRLPPEAEPLGFQASVRPGEPLALTLAYLADQDIGADAAALIAGAVRDRLGEEPGMKVSLERSPRSLGLLTFARRDGALTREARDLLDTAGEELERWPALRAEIALPADSGSAAGAEGRVQAVREYLATRWRIDSGRLGTAADPGRRAMALNLRLLAPAW